MYYDKLLAILQDQLNSTKSDLEADIEKKEQEHEAEIQEFKDAHAAEKEVRISHLL